VAKLTPKQERFVAEYLIDLNGSAAARRAGYSERTANEQAARLLANVNIQSALQAAKLDREKRTGITADKVLCELANIANADITDFLEFGPETIEEVDEQGEPVRVVRSSVVVKPSSQVDGRMVAEVSQGKDGSIKFKLHDKMKALEMLGRHLSMFTDNLNHQGQVNVQFNIPRPPKGPVVLEEDE
jgi:phage terminase small subunit